MVPAQKAIAKSNFITCLLVKQAIKLNKMQTKKMSLANTKELSRAEMKMITAGGSGTCCAHSPSGYSSCGIDKATAIARADYYASTTGNQAFWCCASC